MPLLVPVGEQGRNLAAEGGPVFGESGGGDVFLQEADAVGAGEERGVVGVGEQVVEHLVLARFAVFGLDQVGQAGGKAGGVIYESPSQEKFLT